MSETPDSPPLADGPLHDVAIIGGGPAGLTAAIWLGRYLRTVALIDSGDPRNWETRGVNGFLGQPDVRPAELRGIGRDECRKYDVRMIDGCVDRAVRCHDDLFILTLADGREVRAQRLLLAFGIRDVWPDVPGLERIYGDRAHVCPDCDGYETRGRKTVVIGTGRKAVGMALNLTTWTDQLTICTNAQPHSIEPEHDAKLMALGIETVTEPIERIRFREGDLRSLEFTGRAHLGCEKIFFAIAQYPADDVGVQLTCDRDEEERVVIDDVGHTSVRNVWAAGDLTPGPQLAISAAAQGAVAALAIHKSLVPAERKL